ncbi:outer membrane beta-barrel protein [Natroniella sulfidigena]|uniref:outer membrane beta-barrel protein n=1 Tax=Natroniella sulfidigena TaxID=723921 RepID=UPI00200B7873|nr:outer membrane beta-barrel protein [Natroniella sulfidigena]MCK8817632.1 outer membrane beta-barrel protein [Natroniella sulfidigena]
MKKFVVIIVVMALVILPTQALAKGFEMVGGSTYNTFLLSLSVDGEDVLIGDGIKERLEDGVGFYAGGRYWLNEQLGIEVGVDQATSSYGDSSSDSIFEIEEELVGPYAGVTYRLNDKFQMEAGAVNYSYKQRQREIYQESEEFNEVSAKGEGLGLLVGGQYSHTITDNLALVGNLNHRIIMIDINEAYDYEEGSLSTVEEERLNMSGLRASAGISYNF